jgi:FSR family fosmidomycin resistance protein-like MFS transporter
MNRKTFWLVSLSHFLNDGNVVVLPIVYTFLLSSFGISTLLVGFLGGTFSAVSALSALLVGRLADRYRRPNRLIGLGILMWGLSLMLLGVTVEFGNLVLIFGCVALAGLSSAFYHPLGAVSLTQAFGGRAGSLMGLNGALGSIGRAIFPTLLMFLFSRLPFSHPSMLFPLLIVGGTSFLAAFPLLGREATRPVPVEDKTVVMAGLWPQILFIAFISFLWNMFAMSTAQFLPTLLVDIYHLNFNIDLGFVVTASMAGAVLGQPVLGLLSDRAGRRFTFGLASFGGPFFFLLFLLWPSVVWLICAGFFIYSMFPVILTLVGELVPQRASGLANAVVWGIGSSGGAALGPVLIGFLAGIVGLAKAMLIITCLGLASVLLIPFIRKPKAR